MIPGWDDFHEAQQLQSVSKRKQAMSSDYRLHVFQMEHIQMGKANLFPVYLKYALEDSTKILHGRPCCAHFSIYKTAQYCCSLCLKLF